MLADHLDAALAAGEDLVARGQDWRALAEASEADTAFALAQHANRRRRSRLRADADCPHFESPRTCPRARLLDKRFAAVANLFVSGTALLLDAVDECGDAREDDFETGDGVVAYVRSRGLISPEAANVLTPRS